MASYLVNLDPVPSQEFTASVGTNSFVCRLKYAGIMLFSCSLNGEEICRDTPCPANRPVFAYQWQRQLAGGSFIFWTERGEWPHFENFNSSCSMTFEEDV